MDIPEDKREAQRQADELREQGQHTRAAELMREWYFKYGSKQ